MSNCVQIEDDGIFVIKKDDLDAEFYQLVSETTSMPNTDSLSPEQMIKVMAGGEFGIFYWFLNSNVQPADDGEVLILLGHGRSTHTFRDLQGTMETINKHYHGVPRCVKLMVSDEGDGFNHKFIEKFYLKNFS